MLQLIFDSNHPARFLDQDAHAKLTFCLVNGGTYPGGQWQQTSATAYQEFSNAKLQGDPSERYTSFSYFSDGFPGLDTKWDSEVNTLSTNPGFSSPHRASFVVTNSVDGEVSHKPVLDTFVLQPFSVPCQLSRAHFV